MQKETSDTASAVRWKTLLARLRGNRRLEALLYGALALVVVGVYLTGALRGKAENGVSAAPETSSSAVSEAEAERRLTEVLSSIRGAGRVEVMITYETDGEIVTAMSTSTDSDSSTLLDGERESAESRMIQETTVALRSGADGDEPIVLMERRPAVRGVIVVAEGAADVSVRMDLQRAVRAVLDIPLSSIEVFELRGMD